MDIKNISFKEYLNLQEEIIPPSGKTIGPSGPSGPSNQNTPAAVQNPNIKSLWPGQGAPVQQGMTVALKDKQGKNIPGQIGQVDKSANGVKIKNPATGQDEWMNIDNLQPYQPDQEVQTEDLRRLQELAGIAESASAGATSAAAIAVAPASMGKVKRCQETEESLTKEYTPKESAKSIIGDTKPNQASGELSANLAASGKKVASRINNGKKR